MSHIISCDGGCGYTSIDPSDFTVVGVITEREYCYECAPIALQYQKDLDALHDELTHNWKTKVDRLKANTRKRLPKGELPDE